jgi:hypothetical protein
MKYMKTKQIIYHIGLLAVLFSTLDQLSTSLCITLLSSVTSSFMYHFLNFYQY